MITSKKQKLITALKTLKESQVTKEYEYATYGPKNKQLFCFNGWIYHKLNPKTSFKTLMNLSTDIMAIALTTDLLMAVNGLHYHYIHNTITFKTAMKLVVQEINST